MLERFVMGLKKGTVKLEKYNPNWKTEFKKEKIILSDMFQDVALTIEHIGSTSVEGLSAKPIIDIAVGVKKLSDFEKVKEKFLRKPYTVKEESVPGEVLVRKGAWENITHFIHVMEVDSDRYKNAILFRDYLKENPKALKDYEELKTELAKKYADDRPSYTASKNDFINKIINLSKEGKKYGN